MIHSTVIKKAFLLCLFFVSFLLQTSAKDENIGIQFYKGTWEEALNKAAFENKLIFVDAFTSWCGPCKKMTAQTFPDKALGEYFNENFINLKIDMEKGEGTNFASKYGVFSYPTLLFIDANGKIVQREIGFKTADILLNIGKKVINTTTDTKALDEKYESKEYDNAFLINYAKALMKAKKPYNHIIDEYLLKQSDKNTREYFDFIYEYTSNYDSRIFNVFLENKDKIIEYQGETNFKNKLIAACSKFSFDAGLSNTPKLLKNTEAIVKQNAPNELKQYNLLSKANYALGEKNYKTYSNLIFKYAQKYQWKNKTELQNIMKQMLQIPKSKDIEIKIQELQSQINLL